MRGIRLFIAVACFAAASARAAEPKLDALKPLGGQRGTEVAVKFSGSRLGKDPQQLLFYEPGIDVRGLERVDDNQVKATLSIAPDCPLGIHAFRVRTATGLSNLRTFHVGSLPEIVEEEPNNDFAKPQAIPLGVVVNGVIASEDVDFFVVEAAEGERITAEVEGLRLGRTFFDPSIVILDDQRAEVSSADDSSLLHQDCFCSILAPKPGRYIIQLRETSYRGSDECSYRLHVGKFQRPTGAFPGGGKPGQSLEVKWLGDPGGEKTETVALPDPAPQEFSIDPAGDAEPSATGVPLRVIDLPNVIETEPNDSREAATAGEIPGAFCGIIEKPGDVDSFQFSAKKGEVWDFNLVAREIRSPLDGVLRLRNAKGDVVANADDNAGKPDSYIRYTTPEDGTYTADISDQLHQGGSTYLYRLEVSRPRPIVDLALEERVRYEATEVVVPQGNTMAVMASANRVDVGGDLNVAFDKLPEGVTQEEFPLAGDFNRVPILLRAAADAPLAAALTPLTASLVDNSQPLLSRFKQQTWLVRGTNNSAMWNHWADRAPIAVVQPAPFIVRIVEPKAPLVQSGTKELHIVAERSADFDGRIAVRMLYDPPGVSSHQGIGIEPGKTEAVIPLTTSGDARTRDWRIIVVAEADVDGPVRTSTEFATLRIVPQYLSLKLPKATTEQGKSLTYTIPIEQRTAFSGDAKIELLGLPPGVTTTSQLITEESKEVTFPLTIAADARPGRNKQLFCQVTIMENDEPVVHNIGGGELRIEAPLPPAQTAGQPPKPPGGPS